MRDYDYAYITKWINSIAPNLAPRISFKDWIKGFEERYPIDLLRVMELEWNKYS